MQTAGQLAASDAARAAVAAAGAAHLHPLAKASQVKHILGAAAHAARAFELAAGDDPAVGVARIEQARVRAHPVVVGASASCSGSWTRRCGEAGFLCRRAAAAAPANSGLVLTVVLTGNL